MFGFTINKINSCFHKASDGMIFSQNYDLAPFAFILNINEVVMKQSNWNIVLSKKILWKLATRKVNWFNFKHNFENVIDEKLTIVPPKVIWQIVVRFLELKETHGFHMLKNRTFIDRKLPPFDLMMFATYLPCSSAS